MLESIKTKLVKLLFTEEVCAWLVQTALNAALVKSKDAEKRTEVCGMLSNGASLLKTAAEACADGTVDEREANTISTVGYAFGQNIYALIKG